MNSCILQQLTTSDTWGVVSVVAMFGAAGSLVHRATTPEEIEPWWKTALVGVVAAIGFAAFRSPDSGIELVGISVLAGFFARVALAALEARIKLELSRQQAHRALSLASDAIELSRRTRTAPATAVPELDIGRLSARLDEVRGSGLVKP
jgi:hypothetical protein